MLLPAALGLVLLVTAVLKPQHRRRPPHPVLILVARQRRAVVEPVLYGCVFMANASSLLLPGSNLTILLVLSQGPASGSDFAVQIFPEAASAAIVTALGLLVLFRRNLAGRDHHARPCLRETPSWPGPTLALLQRSLSSRPF